MSAELIQRQRGLLRHVLEPCDDPDCEIHKIRVGLDEETVSPADLAFFLAGAQAMEMSIRRHFDRGLDYNDDQRKRLITACLYAGRPMMRLALIHAYGCSDCGAPAGRECRHDYGCTDADRTVV